MAARVKLAGGGRVGSHRGRGAGPDWIAPEPPKAISYHPFLAIFTSVSVLISAPEDSS